MPISGKSKSASVTSLVISDNGDANSFTYPSLMGDLSFSIPGRAINSHLTKGQFASSVGGTPDLSYGADQPITGSFSFHLRDISDASYATELEFCLGPSGLVSTGWTGTLGSSHPVQDTWRLKWTIDGTDFSEADHWIRFRHAQVRGDVTNSVEGISATGNFTDYEVYPEYQ